MFFSMGFFEKGLPGHYHSLANFAYVRPAHTSFCVRVPYKNFINNGKLLERAHGESK